MSLDVCLTLKGAERTEKGSGIFIREDGQTREISRAEWDEKFPGREPVIYERQYDNDEVYERNITHNLNRMADVAGIYNHLWRPDEIGITQAKQLIEPLKAGLEMLKSDPERFKMHNPRNGWGNYEGLVDFVAEYLAACEKYPEAEVSVSR